MTLAAEREQRARWNLGGSFVVKLASSQPSYHPGTRVIVEYEPARHRPMTRPAHAFKKPVTRHPAATASPPARGSVSAILLAELRNLGYWPLRICFEETSQLTPDPGGKLSVSVTVGRDGLVRAPTLHKRGFQHESIESCVVTALSQLRLHRAPPKPTRLQLRISLWPGDAPLAPPALPQQLKNREVADFDRAFLASRGVLTSCLRSARMRDPGIWGRIELRLRLRPAAAPEVQQHASAFASREAVDCAASALANVDWPALREQREFSVALRLPPTQPAPAPEQPREDSQAPADVGEPEPRSAEPTD